MLVILSPEPPCLALSHTQAPTRWSSSCRALSMVQDQLLGKLILKEKHELEERRQLLLEEVRWVADTYNLADLWPISEDMPRMGYGTDVGRTTVPSSLWRSEHSIECSVIIPFPAVT